MEYINYDEFLTPTDADILRIVKHSPELLIESFDIKRRYNKIIKILDGYTIRDNNIYRDNITVS